MHVALDTPGHLPAVHVTFAPDQVEVVHLAELVQHVIG